MIGIYLRFLEKLESNHFCQNLYDFIPFGLDGGYFVLREYIEPILCVWNPMTMVSLILPMKNAITHTNSYILRVDDESFQLVLIKLNDWDIPIDLCFNRSAWKAAIDMSEL